MSSQSKIPFGAILSVLVLALVLLTLMLVGVLDQPEPATETTVAPARNEIVVPGHDFDVITLADERHLMRHTVPHQALDA